MTTAGENISQAAAMPQAATLDYGRNSRITVELTQGTLVAYCGNPRAAPLDDPTAAVAASLVDPVDYPPLAQTVVPGDRVVLAIQSGVPQAAWVVAGIVQTLLEARIASGNISIVLSPAFEAGRMVTSLLPDTVREGIRVTRHDPRDRGGLAYLAATQSGMPVYINRTVCEADLVVTVGCLTGRDAEPNGVFPAFADWATLERYAAIHPSSAEFRRGRHEADEAAWLLGARFTVQVIPGSAGRILHVLSGDIDSVRSRGLQLARAAWCCEIPCAASLVVAAIPGADEQRWDCATRALEAARRVVAEGGTILLCTEIDERPPLAEPEHEDSDSPPPADSWCADRDRMGFAGTAGETRVYLLSKLHPDIVEDLGIVPVSSAKEVANLCRRHSTCIFLANSQYARPSIPRSKTA
jgi:hypothetical protein